MRTWLLIATIRSVWETGSTLYVALSFLVARYHSATRRCNLTYEWYDSMSLHCLAAVNSQTVAGYKIRPIRGIEEDGFSDVYG